MTENKAANPAVVGLAGFGITTLLLQIHNLGLCGVGPVFCAAVMFGGLAQMIAGYFEFKCGNNFGFSAFVSYGAFWLGLALMWMLIDMKAGGHLLSVPIFLFQQMMWVFSFLGTQFTLQ